MSESSFPTEPILSLIRTIRGQRVILAPNPGKLYGVETKRLNEQVGRNRAKFPSDFLFQLTREEAIAHSRSQIATLKRGQHKKYLPYAFTEYGALMAANVLNSPKAVAMSVYIVRAFVQQRDVLAANETILTRLAEIDKTLLATTRPCATFTRSYCRFSSHPPTRPGPKLAFASRWPNTVPENRLAP